VFADPLLHQHFVSNNGMGYSKKRRKKYEKSQKANGKIHTRSKKIRPFPFQ